MTKINASRGAEGLLESIFGAVKRPPVFPSVIFVQGPPRSGKDTAAQIISQVYDCMHMKFAMPIRAMLAGIVPSVLEDIERAKNHSLKQYNPDATDITIRQLMIEFSEEFIKPRLGEAAFGYASLEFVKRHVLNGQPIVFSDSGFPDEAVPFIEYFGPGNCLIIQLTRVGTSFKGDSRNYWSHPKVMNVILPNDGTVDILQKGIGECLSSYIDKQEGLKHENLQ